MRKLAMFLAILAAPLCADNYVSVGVGPYLMMPNVGVGYLHETEFGEVDINYNLSSSGTSYASEAKIALRIPMDEFYCGPSMHIDYQKVRNFSGDTNFGCGVLFGKNFDWSFIDMSVQKDMMYSFYKSEIYNVKIRYGTRF